MVVRADSAAAPPGMPTEVRGAPAVLEQAITYAERTRHAEAALVNGGVGVVVAPSGRLFMVLTVALKDAKIAEIDVIADPERLRQLDLAVLDAVTRPRD